MARDQAVGNVAKQEAGVEAADAKAKKIADQAAVKLREADAVAAGLAEKEAEKKRLDMSERERVAAVSRLPAMEAAAKKARLDATNSSRRKEADAAQELLENTRNEAYRNPGDAKKLKELNLEIAAQKAAQEKAKAEAETLAKDASEAKLDAKNQRDILNTTAPLAGQTYQTEPAGRANTTKAAAEAARASEREKQDRAAALAKNKTAAEQRRAAQDKNANEQEDLNSDARTTGRQIKGAGLKSGNKTLQGIGDKLSDGTNADELRRIGDMVVDKQRELGERTVATLTKLLGALGQQAKKIEVVEHQIRNMRSIR